MTRRQVQSATPAAATVAGPPALEIKDLSSLPLLETDLEALYKVFYHLIVNAVKYTPDGGRITVSGRTLEPRKLPSAPAGGKLFFWVAPATATL